MIDGILGIKHFGIAQITRAFGKQRLNLRAYRFELRFAAALHGIFNLLVDGILYAREFVSATEGLFGRKTLMPGNVHLGENRHADGLTTKRSEFFAKLSALQNLRRSEEAHQVPAHLSAHVRPVIVGQVLIAVVVETRKKLNIREELQERHAGFEHSIAREIAFFANLRAAHHGEHFEVTELIGHGRNGLSIRRGNGELEWRPRLQVHEGRELGFALHQFVFERFELTNHVEKVTLVAKRIERLHEAAAARFLGLSQSLRSVVERISNLVAQTLGADGREPGRTGLTSNISHHAAAAFFGGIGLVGRSLGFKVAQTEIEHIPREFQIGRPAVAFAALRRHERLLAGCKRFARACELVGAVAIPCRRRELRQEAHALHISDVFLHRTLHHGQAVFEVVLERTGNSLFHRNGSRDGFLRSEHQLLVDIGKTHKIVARKLFGRDDRAAGEHQRCGDGRRNKSKADHPRGFHLRHDWKS